MKAKNEIMKILAKAEEDVSLGRIGNMEDTFANLRATLNEKHGNR